MEVIFVIVRGVRRVVDAAKCQLTIIIDQRKSIEDVHVVLDVLDFTLGIAVDVELLSERAADEELRAQ